MKDIPAGYQIHVTSWENDADSYATKIVSGLTEADVAFLVGVLGICHSRNGRSKMGIGNGALEGDKAELLIDHVTELLTLRANDKSPTLDAWREALADEIRDGEEADEFIPGSHFYELLVEFLGYPYEELYRCEYTNFCRVAQTIEVFHLKEAAKNVSKQFV